VGVALVIKLRSLVRERSTQTLLGVGRAGTCALLFALVACSTSPSPGNASSPTALAPTLSPGSATPTASTDWTTYHRDAARTGFLAEMPDPQRLTLAWRTSLDGAVYGEPLVVGGHVLVATEGDSLYSLDARTGQIEWRTNVGQPVPLAAL